MLSVAGFFMRMLICRFFDFEFDQNQHILIGIHILRKCYDSI